MLRHFARDLTTARQMIESGPAAVPIETEVRRRQQQVSRQEKAEASRQAGRRQ